MGVHLVALTPGQGLHRSRNSHLGKLACRNEGELREP
jgi:hypothetical protein